VIDTAKAANLYVLFLMTLPVLTHNVPGSRYIKMQICRFFLDHHTFFPYGSSSGSTLSMHLLEKAYQLRRLYDR
jgi:hypothetical protein